LQSEGSSQAAPSVVEAPGPVEEPVESSADVGSVSLDPSLVVLRIVPPVGSDVSLVVPASLLESGPVSVAVSADGASEGEKQAVKVAT